MPSVIVRADTRHLIEHLGTMQRKQLPWAMRWALEATTRDGANAVENAIQQRFHASPQGMRWMLRHVKRFAPSSRLARGIGGSGGYGVGIVPPGGRKGNYAGWSRYRGSMLPMLEAGGPTPGPKRFGGAASGATSDYGRYAIPVRRHTDRTRIPMSLWPVNLGLSSRVGIERGRNVGGGLRGKRRTFMVPIVNSPGNAMIFQRFGRGPGSDVMPLFWTQRDTHLPARRYFFPTMQRVIDTRLASNFKRAMEHALFNKGRPGA